VQVPVEGAASGGFRLLHLVVVPSGHVDLRRTLAHARLAELALAHRGGDREAAHREAHPLSVDVTLGMEAGHGAADILAAHADVTSELVEADEPAARLSAGEVTEDVSCDGTKGGSAHDKVSFSCLREVRERTCNPQDVTKFPKVETCVLHKHVGCNPWTASQLSIFRGKTEAYTSISAVILGLPWVVA
jgi:hypothetical protein